MINRAWNRSASFRLTQWLKIIPHMIRSYYRCCCINEPVIFSHCVRLNSLRTILNYGCWRFAGIFAERPTEWSAMLNPGAGNQRFDNSVYLYIHVSTVMQYLCIVHVYMYTYAHVCTMRLYTSPAYLSVYAAIHVNRPSGISQAADIAVNCTQGVKLGHRFHALLKVSSDRDDTVPPLIIMILVCKYYFPLIGSLC